MTHKPLIDKGQREKIVHSLFESGQLQGVFLTTDAQMSLRAVGKATGLIVDVGDDATYIVPIFEDMVVRTNCTCDTPLHAAILKSISLCDEFLQSDLIAQVVCCGSVCALPGFKDRLSHEIQKAIGHQAVHVDVVRKSQYAPFVGASMYVKGLHDGVWISRDDYDARGPAIVHSKCF
ncbi:hypothetical protein DYB32_001908 [Aphanomyces invadans]|uniref:Uncharacterized protein n=1 Tax=Aphanomyces invadans TaxID=157072 RepID=A0A3R7D4R2_9STRA|nr:hypothetical protein DYB32_001908 [Aphanomyces invadans]